MPRKSDAKEHLLEAALSLIWENSYGSTSVDDICAKAGVKKGSFYHFFASKSELAVAGLEADRLAKEVWMDQVFSPTVPPLERLERFFDGTLEMQEAKKQSCGHVLGCPLVSVGSEVTTQESEISAKVRETLARNLKYFETAVRDAHAEGLIDAPDASKKARMLFSLLLGASARARVCDCLEPIYELKAMAFDVLGVKHPASV